MAPGYAGRVPEHYSTHQEKTMSKRRRLVISNVICISDIHAGCKMALCPPGEIRLDDGGTYKGSKFQRKMWTWWREFWDEWVPRVTRGEPYAVVFNGDAIDGVHHGSTTQISHNLVDQARIAKMILAPIVEMCEGRFYMIRGTEAHGGSSLASEESLAESLNAIPDEEGRYARYELWKYIGPENKRLCGLAHFMHHIGTTSSSAYESTAVHKELAEAFYEAGRWGCDRRMWSCVPTVTGSSRQSYRLRAVGQHLSSPQHGRVRRRSHTRLRAVVRQCPRLAASYSDQVMKKSSIRATGCVTSRDLTRSR